MRAEEVSLEVLEAAWLESLAPILEECLVVLPRHKADLLAVLLVSDLEAEFAGNPTDLFLGKGSKREEGAPELFSAQAEEEVGLIFFRIKSLAQNGSLVFGMLHRGVMTGGDELSAKGGGFVPEVAEFQFLVAHDAGVGRASGAVFICEVINHQSLEGNGLVDDEMGDAQSMGNAAGVSDSLRAATFVLGARHAILRPEFHGNTDDIPSLFLEQPGSDTGVNAAAHAHDDASGSDG